MLDAIIELSHLTKLALIMVRDTECYLLKLSTRDVYKTHLYYGPATQGERIIPIELQLYGKTSSRLNLAVLYIKDGDSSRS